MRRKPYAEVVGVARNSMAMGNRFLRDSNDRCEHAGEDFTCHGCALNMPLDVFAIVVGLSVIGLIGCWGLARSMERSQRDNAQRMANAEGRLKTLYVRLNVLETEVTKQGVELEELSIQLETKAYWDE